MEKNEEYYTVKECTVKRETDKAILVDSEELNEGPTWIPISQIANDSEVKEMGDDGDLIVSSWFASQKGWL